MVQGGFFIFKTIEITIIFNYFYGGVFINQSLLIQL